MNDTLYDSDRKHIAAPLLAWFDANKRVLPFRTESTPYRVWVSEIMLQQTRVSAALPFFERFMAELPTIADLAACDPERLHKLWEGLGYYSRVRNLQKAAQIVMDNHDGALPADYAALRKLPGIGEYTAGAIASISFGLPEVAVDGNVLRVFARLYCDDGNILHPDTKKRMSQWVQAEQPADRPGAYNEALMELGALVCIPNGAPLCGECPLASCCAARAAGCTAALPVKTALKARKLVPLTAILVEHDGRILLQQRPDSGLLAGLWQPLLLDGTADAMQTQSALAALGIDAERFAPLPQAKHIFTHLEWHMTGWYCHAKVAALPPDCVWADVAEIESVYTLPNAFKVYRKCAMQQLAGTGARVKK